MQPWRRRTSTSPRQSKPTHHEFPSLTHVVSLLDVKSHGNHHRRSRRHLLRAPKQYPNPYFSTDLLPPKTGPAPLTTFQRRLQCPRRLGLRGSRRFQTEVPLRLPPISSILSLTAHGLQALRQTTPSQSRRHGPIHI